MVKTGVFEKCLEKSWPKQTKTQKLDFNKIYSFYEELYNFFFFFYAFGALLGAFWAPFGDLFGS